jgi:methionyl-tRNA synthetase
MVTYEDFKKLEIKVAKITQVKDHPNADKLYIMIIDLGDKTKQIIAGIKGFYDKEELLGRKIVVIDNLEPVKLRGEESQAMLLAAQDESGIAIITPDKEVKIGSIVK